MVLQSPVNFSKLYSGTLGNGKNKYSCLCTFTTLNPKTLNNPKPLNPSIGKVESD